MPVTKPFIPTTDPGKVTWLNNFSTKAPNYVGQCTITATDVATVQKLAAFWEFLVSFQKVMRTAGEGFTSYKDDMRDGLSSGTADASILLPDLAVYPTLPAPPPAVNYGIFPWMRDLCARIKRAPDYLESIGQALGIEAPATPNKPVAEMQPGLTFRGLSGGHPQLRVNLDGAEQVEIFVDRGTGGWVQLTITVRSEFTDMHPLPPAGTAQVWRYRAACRDANGVIGQMSEVLSVTVSAF